MIDDEGHDGAGVAGTAATEAGEADHRAGEVSTDAQTRRGSKPAASREPPSWSPGRTLGRYTLTGVLGSGGMGTVFEAHDESVQRSVAIKRLHPETTSGQAARLEREAQALAKLSHPNVVSVYEVGQAEGQRFIAMELVRGPTLRRWHEAEHHWRACVSLYVEAGEGLAAAHAAGLVHRDFKPDNCIVDEQGRPRVLDFGIVRDTSEDASDDPSAQVVELRDDRSTGARLTRDGMVLGTLGYMPLEQLDGRTADARSDQFSFCVSLYEAIYGERPFVSESVGQFIMALGADEVRPPPKGARVPGALRQALLRGLSSDPERRWPTMESLLAELRRIAAPVRVRVPARLAGAGIVGLLAAGAWLWTRADPPAPCRGGAAQLEGVWDEERRQALEGAMLGTELSYAAETWERVEGELDEYGASWVRKHAEVCEATTVRHEQTAEDMDLRMRCLERCRTELRETVAVLSQASPARVRRAVEMVLHLRPLSWCDDLDTLRLEVPPPDDPEVQARVVAMRERLAIAGSLGDAGSLERGLAEAEAVLEEAQRLDYPPLEAEALHLRGQLHYSGGQFVEAERDLERAYLLATESSYDHVALSAVTTLVLNVGRDQGRPDEGLQWGKAALASIQRVEASVPQEAQLLRNMGAVLEFKGALDESLEYYRRALALEEGAPESRHNRVADSINGIGIVLATQGRLDDALTHFRRALTLQERTFGMEHPDVGVALNNIATALAMKGAYDESLEYYERALGVRERSQGPEHPDVAETLQNMGAVVMELGRPEQAMAYYRRAQTIMEKALDTEQSRLGSILDGIGNVLLDQGRYEEALEHFRRGLAIREAVLGARHMLVADSLNSIGDVLVVLGELDDAIEHFVQAESIWQETLGPEHSRIGVGAANLALVHEERGDLDQAIVQHRRALEIWNRGLGSDHPRVGHSLNSIGRILVEQGKLDEAEREYRQALALWEARDEPHPEEAKTYLGLARWAMAREDATAALEFAERAVALTEGLEADSVTRARARFVLARVLWADPEQRRRAKELARLARAVHAEAGPAGAEDLAEIDAWMEERGVAAEG